MIRRSSFIPYKIYTSICFAWILYCGLLILNHKQIFVFLLQLIWIMNFVWKCVDNFSLKNFCFLYFMPFCNQKKKNYLLGYFIYNHLTLKFVNANKNWNLFIDLVRRERSNKFHSNKKKFIHEPKWKSCYRYEVSHTTSV